MNANTGTSWHQTEYSPYNLLNHHNSLSASKSVAQSGARVSQDVFPTVGALITFVGCPLNETGWAEAAEHRKPVLDGKIAPTGEVPVTSLSP